MRFVSRRARGFFSSVSSASASLMGSAGFAFCALGTPPAGRGVLDVLERRVVRVGEEGLGEPPSALRDVVEHRLHRAHVAADVGHPRTDDRPRATLRAASGRKLHVDAGLNPPSGIFITRASGSVVDARGLLSRRPLSSCLTAAIAASHARVLARLGLRACGRGDRPRRRPRPTPRADGAAPARDRAIRRDETRGRRGPRGFIWATRSRDNSVWSSTASTSVKILSSATRCDTNH